MSDQAEIIIVRELSAAIDSLIGKARDALPPGIVADFNFLAVAAMARSYARFNVKAWRRSHGALPPDEACTFMVVTGLDPMLATFKDERDLLAAEQEPTSGN